MSGIVFIAGYVGYKLKGEVDCIDCRLTERALDCDYPCDENFDYLSAVDRGRLTWPTDLMVEIVVQAVIVFKCLVCPSSVKKILKCSQSAVGFGPTCVRTVPASC